MKNHIFSKKVEPILIVGSIKALSDKNENEFGPPKKN